ncbi:8-amino-7-oxononanoate synthase [Dissulfuribacter thermophilus]|uniref:8-amino-7-oxononanoate synthase n=1 Tax=Dissulfuribacter thermophilus TaxID=1156395 RepID=A0A1B9F4R6_9BACT|nr:8-amino-7-oxononanoate synthase [Dissulfuribacter thermophilus]OCC14949.1 8-amino-7-oxononanoate synthase [Dissulfuribacter thermophilus]
MFEDELNKIAAYQGLRKVEPFEYRKGPEILINGRRFLDFSSNDYLGLSQDPFLKQKIGSVFETVGMGSGGSRLLGGANSLFEQLEYELSESIGKEASLVFGTGYLANLGVMTALSQKKKTIFFMDRLCHASIIDGVLLSGSHFFRFRHNDPDHLERLLREKSQTGKRNVVVIESLYSMDGDLAPIEDIIELKKRYDFILVVDEAHAIGVLGKEGRGAIEDRTREAVDIIVGTFGKALGGYGAFCLTSKVIRELLVNKARSFIFSTALPIPVVAWNLEALRFMKGLDDRRKRLSELSEDLREFVKNDLGFTTPGQAQIVPVIVGENETTLRAQNALRDHGIYLRAIRPPTVPKGTSRLRISLSSVHSKETLSRLKDALRSVEF